MDRFSIALGKKSYLPEFIRIGSGFTGIPCGGPVGTVLQWKTLTPGKMTTE
jgi:hypothetical protein